jgi:hypothetical protein
MHAHNHSHVHTHAHTHTHTHTHELYRYTYKHKHKHTSTTRTPAQTQTRTHARIENAQAPELLLAGRVSRASDAYAFGILLWELYTGGHAYAGMPRALLVRPRASAPRRARRVCARARARAGGSRPRRPRRPAARTRTRVRGRPLACPRRPSPHRAPRPPSTLPQGHGITKQGMRPQFPPDTPFDYSFLACRCWETDADIRRAAPRPPPPRGAARRPRPRPAARAAAGPRDPAAAAALPLEPPGATLQQEPPRP